ncbi:MAG: HdeD family acid-resistance protein [Ilumatobacteraceae bacterium]
MESRAIQELPEEITRQWWVFLVSGVLWILFAWVVLSFDYTTVWAVAVFFGFGLIAGGAMSVMIGLNARSWRWVHVAFGVISIVAGVFALAWPGQTFLVLAGIIGWYVMFTGVLDLAMAFATRDDNDLWWLQLVLGIAQVLIGFWAIGYEGRSIALLVIWVGATALARGISSLFLGFGLHGAGRQLRQRMAGPPVTPAGT